MQTIPSISPKPPVVTFYHVRYHLQNLSAADEWKIMRATYERKQAQNGYNLELLEVEERRRKQLMVPSAVA
jgi:hypothetical protein